MNKTIIKIVHLALAVVLFFFGYPNILQINNYAHSTAVLFSSIIAILVIENLWISSPVSKWINITLLNILASIIIGSLYSVENSRIAIDIRRLLSLHCIVCNFILAIPLKNSHIVKRYKFFVSLMITVPVVCMLQYGRLSSYAFYLLVIATALSIAIFYTKNLTTNKFAADDRKNFITRDFGMLGFSVSASCCCYPLSAMELFIAFIGVVLAGYAIQTTRE